MPAASAWRTSSSGLGSMAIDSHLAEVDAGLNPAKCVSVVGGEKKAKGSARHRRQVMAVQDSKGSALGTRQGAVLPAPPKFGLCFEVVLTTDVYCLRRQQAQAPQAIKFSHAGDL